MKSKFFTCVTLFFVSTLIGLSSLSAQTACMSKVQALNVIQTEMVALSSNPTVSSGSTISPATNAPTSILNERRLKLAFIKDVAKEIKSGAATTWAAVQIVDQQFRGADGFDSRLSSGIYTNVYGSVLTLLQCN